MEIYLIRHTKPLIDEQVCYGQSDIPIEPGTFEAAAKNLLIELPDDIDAVYSSPLVRCSYLARYIIQEKYPNKNVNYSSLLKEVNFGDWENKRWDVINQTDLQNWMNDFVNQPPPGGESFRQLHQRTMQFIQSIFRQAYNSVAIVAHAGTIRSIICHLEKTELKDSFTILCDYGSIRKIHTP